jgi:RsiW-degrading membrane proteinase PrsW (M82 family)
MSIAFACTGCGKSFKVKDELAGRKARCACGQMLTVPKPAPAPAPAEAPEEDIFAFKDDEPVKAPKRASVMATAGATAGAPGGAMNPNARPPSTSSIPSMPAPPPHLPQPAKPYAPPVATGGRLPLQSPQLAAGGGATRRFAYLVLLAAMIPLVFSTLANKKFDIDEALAATVKKHPEIEKKLTQILESEEASEEELFAILPDHRLEGAFLARDSYVHWLYALCSSVAFTGLILLIFPRGTHSLGKMLLVGLFTATAGIFLLLGFQWIADATQGMWVRGRSVLVLLFYIVKFIGYSYRAALDPESNFFLSTIGFTLGVGLCEEIVKALPVLFHYQTTSPENRWPWRTACMVGLLSGIGFGVSEGIHYSSDFYNGVLGGDIYCVRFISCVALHAVWSGAAAVFIFRHQGQLQQVENFFAGMLTWAAMVAVPMVLHGFYDTLLKKDMEGWALLTALASFAWLIYQIEGARRDFPEEDAVPA